MFVMSARAVEDLFDVPRSDQTRIHSDLRRLTQDPQDPGLDIQKLRDRDDLYRLRCGDWRIFYTLGDVPEIQAIRRRSDTTYGSTRQVPVERLGDITLTGAHVDIPDDEQSADEALARGTTVQEKDPLPRPLTPELLRQWRISSEHHPALSACRTGDDLLELQIDPRVVERVVGLLYPGDVSDAQRGAQYLVHDVDELRAYVEGELTELLLRLDEEQLKMADWRLDGPAMVRGGAGTGKTVIALYRVMELAKRNPGARVLFTTYTRTLARYAKELLHHLTGSYGVDVDLTVETVDTMVRRHAPRPEKMASEQDARDAIHDLLAVENDPLLKQLGATYLFEEFETIIEGWGTNGLDEYLRADRTGRKLPLYDDERKKVWRLYTAWRAKLKAQNKITWNQLRRTALERAKPSYDAVIIDEAQDLAPVALRFLVKLARNPKGLYLTADANQSIYERGFSWRMVDKALDMRGKSAILKRDYRTTRQINAAVRELAVSLELDTSGFPEAGSREGAVPSIIELPADGFYEQLASRIKEACRDARMPLGSVAVLAPRKSLVEDLVAELNLLDIDAVPIQDEELGFDHPAVKVMTLQSAKGLEFPIVFVVGVDEGVIPRRVRDVPEEELPTYEEQEARLLYVACSRAMRSLTVAHSTGSPSRFISGLTDRNAWQHSLTTAEAAD